MTQQTPTALPGGAQPHGSTILDRWRQRQRQGDEQARADAEADFRRRFPEYGVTSVIDRLRATEYERLDRLGQVYLDYTGGSLYAESQLRAHLALLREHVLGNPHSTNPTSRAATELVERTRAAVLSFFNAPPDEYALVFTPNASGALRLVGEAYPFAPGGDLLLSCDNHNSVNGIREFARAGGVRHSYAPLTPGELRLDEGRLEELLGAARPDARRLFAFPAQSNFSGAQHSLEWIARAQARGWDVLLDAAAFAPTNRLDLRRWRPDFVSLSFYKLFGYPTGVGALIARRDALRKLRRPWFAGGTVALASALGDGHMLLEGEAGFEDGTVSYLSIPALAFGLRHLSAAGIDTIHTRVACLTGWLLGQLRSLRHRTGEPLVELYGPRDTRMRGGTVALNFLEPRGQLIDYRLVEHRANTLGISLRTGCFCNPGASEAARGLTATELEPFFRGGEPVTLERFRSTLGGRAPGAVRVSVGVASNFADVYAFAQFARGYLDQPAGEAQ
jgi:molybdenum cofactor sulfurtransferase